MPNHCSQDLFVYGDEDAIKDFMDFSKEDDKLLSANKYIPYPKKFSEMDEAAKIAHDKGDWSVKDGFNSGGYEWCLDNWGTKWGIYDAAVMETRFVGKRSRVRYIYDSAWNPALPVIEAMSKKFPTLRFKVKYYECGMGFKGTFEVIDGEVRKNEQSNYSGNRGG